MTIHLRISGLGAHWLGCYGNEWVATPNFDALAAEGVVYDNHYAEHFRTNDDEPLFRRFVDDRRGGPPLQGIRERLNDEEFEAGEHIEIVSDAFVPPWHAPAELVEDFWDGDSDAEPWPDPPNGPLEPESWPRLHATFAAAVTYFDAEFGALREMFPDAEWIVSGSRGFPLGEHGSVGGESLHEESVHLALIVKDGRGPGGEHVMGLTSPGTLTPIANVVTVLSDGSRAVRTMEWTLIDGETPRLYKRPDDRFEINDVSRLHPEVVEMLKQILEPGNRMTPI